jgi:conjugative relaxase-like TrwC/TraI family protein
MSLHKLSAGGGVDYLLKHTCCGDAARDGATPLSAYYTASGYPPGRWMGRGLSGVAAGRGITGVVSEEAMTRLFALGVDPVTSGALGGLWRVHLTAAQRIAQRVHDLPAGLTGTDRAQEIARIGEQENARKTPIAVTGFDLTFTLPKSASVLWALADPGTQTRIANAHADAVADCLALVEAHALFTRIGRNGVAQLSTRGALAAGFDHWDTRTGDPNLHTHLVIANKVQGIDGTWRTVDAKGLYAATVAISETYDVLVADKIAAATGTGWSVRARSERSALFEIDGVPGELLAEFSHRSLQVDASLRGLLTDFHARNNGSPTRAEMLRIRQHATRLSRPVKHLRPLPELLTRWRDRATALLPTSIEEWVTKVTGPRPVAVHATDVTEAQLLLFAKTVVDEATTRRSTWTRWNLIAEAARATKPLRLVGTADRVALLERVAEVAITRFCLPLTPPDLTLNPEGFRRPDGTSAFRRHRTEVFTSPLILAAEDRLLTAARDTTAARATAPEREPGVVGEDRQQIPLAADQAAAVHLIATSGRQLDVLVGPAGSGKTTTMRALLQVWENEYGPRSVIGLAPSAAAARTLADALGIGCENTAKWIHETTGNRPLERRATLDQLRSQRHRAGTAGHSESVARIDADADAGALAEVAQRFQLRQGQLLIVDEASLAGTLVLDELVRQARHAGAKVLLVGDHRQLSAVNAGGAFGLIATDTNATELTSLWRFRHSWEARATQGLRVGDPAAIEAYSANERLHEGPAEVMAADAYRAWAAAIRDGKRALLIAADNSTVAALNDQARADRYTAGQVEAGGVRLHDGTHAGAGDVVVTRANNRQVRTSSGAWVRNGDLWTVIGRSDDGSLTLRRNRDHAEAIERDSVVTLDPGYVATHVELGYATTAHRAQGMTVDTAFTLLRPGMAREVTYVAMTRGRDSNQAFIATDIPDPNYDGAPATEVTGRQVFEQILATQGVQLSATQTLRELHHQAESLATLGAVHETLIQAAAKHRWRTLITDNLPDDVADAVLTSPAYGALVATMRRAEHDGLPINTAFRSLAAAGPLTPGIDETATENGGQGVRDPAAVLHWRVDNWHAQASRTSARGQLLAGLFTPAGPALDSAEPDMRAAIIDIEHRIAGRVTAVTNQLIDSSPPWLRRLGPQPTHAREAARWRAGVSATAAYRDAYGITDTTHPFGSVPPTDPAQHLARRRASTAAGAVVDARHRAAARPQIAPTDRTPSL